MHQHSSVPQLLSTPVAKPISCKHQRKVCRADARRHTIGESDRHVGAEPQRYDLGDTAANRAQPAHRMMLQHPVAQRLSSTTQSGALEGGWWSKEMESQVET